MLTNKEKKELYQKFCYKPGDLLLRVADDGMGKKGILLILGYHIYNEDILDKDIDNIEYEYRVMYLTLPYFISGGKVICHSKWYLESARYEKISQGGSRK